MNILVLTKPSLFLGIGLSAFSSTLAGTIEVLPLSRRTYYPSRDGEKGWQKDHVGDLVGYGKTGCIFCALQDFKLSHL